MNNPFNQYLDKPNPFDEKLKEPNPFDRKLTELGLKAEVKGAKLKQKAEEGWRKLRPDEVTFYDPDTFKINENPDEELRLVGSQKGVSPDAYEAETSANLTYDDPLSEKFKIHSARYAERYNKKQEKVTKEDLHRVERQQMRRLKEEVNEKGLEVLDTGEKGHYGRPLVRARIPGGEELGDRYATEQEGASYESKYNAKTQLDDLMSGKYLEDKRAKESRSIPEFIGDQAISIAKSVNDAAELLRYGVDTITGDIGQEWFDKERQKIEESTEWLESKKSEKAQLRTKQRNEKIQLWREDKPYRIEQRIKNGETELQAELNDIKDSFLHEGSVFLQDPFLLIDTVLEAGAAGGVVVGGAKAAAKAKLKSLAKKAAEDGVELTEEVVKRSVGKAAKAGAVGSTAAVSGLQVGSEVDGEIRAKSFDELEQNSALYREYLEEGLSPEEARHKLASVSGAIAAGLGAVTGAAAAAVTGGAGLEASIGLGSIGKAAGSAAGQVVRQGVEETLQEGAQQLAGNIGKRRADETVNPLQDIGGAAAQGGVVGMAAGGGLAAPKAISDVNKAAETRPGEAKTVGTNTETIIKSKTEYKSNRLKAVLEDWEAKPIEDYIENPKDIMPMEERLTDSIVRINTSDVVNNPVKESNRLNKKIQEVKSAVYGPEAKDIISRINPETTKEEATVVYLAAESKVLESPDIERLKNSGFNTDLIELFEIASLEPINPLSHKSLGYRDGDNNLGIAARLANIRDSISIGLAQGDIDVQGLDNQLQELQDYAQNISSELNQEENLYVRQAFNNASEQVAAAQRFQASGAPIAVQIEGEQGDLFSEGREAEPRLQDFIQKAQDSQAEATTSPQQPSGRQPKATPWESTVGKAQSIPEAIAQRVKEHVAGPVSRTAQAVRNSPLNQGIKEFLGYKNKGVIEDTYQEIVGIPDNVKSQLRQYRAIIDANVGKKNQEISNQVEQQIIDSFEIQLRDKDWQALNETVLRADLSALSNEEAIQALTDSLARQRMIKERESFLETSKEHKRNAKAYIAQARNLANIIINGTTDPEIGIPLTNAYQIAQRLDIDSSRTKDVFGSAEKAIDELVSLYALQLVDESWVKRTNEIIKLAPEGVSNFLNVHRVFKQQSLEENFDNNRIGLFKGYNIESFDPNIVFEVNKIDAEHKKKMQARGYKLEEIIPIDPDYAKLVDGDTELGLYVSRIGNDQRRGQMIVGYDLQNKGFDVLSDLADALQLTNKRQGQVYINKLTEMKRKHPGGQLVPIFNQNTGEIVNFRVLMSDSQKQKLLKRKDLAHQNLGRMFGDIHVKKFTPIANKTIVDELFNNWQENRDKGGRYYYIGSDSSNKSARNAFSQLPKNMQDYARTVFGRNGMYIPENVYTYLMGFQEVSLTGISKGISSKLGKWSGNNIYVPRHLLQGINTADRLWKEVVGQARARIAVLLPDVVVGNMYSNILMLAADGISPMYIGKYGKQGIKDIIQYQKLKNQIGILELNIRSGKGGDKAELESLKRKLAKSSVHELAERGLLDITSVDVNPAALGQNRAPTQIVQNLAKGTVEHTAEVLPRPAGRAVSKAGRAAQEVLMMPNSQLFQFALMANNGADALGRYIKYRYDTEVRGVSPDKAISDALDYFVYYAEPSSATVEAINQYGFIPYTKFYLRMQRVMLKLLGQKAGTAVSVAILDKLMLDETPQSYFLNTEKLWNRADLYPLTLEEGEYTSRWKEATTFSLGEWAKFFGFNR